MDKSDHGRRPARILIRYALLSSSACAENCFSCRFEHTLETNSDVTPRPVAVHHPLMFSNSRSQHGDRTTKGSLGNRRTSVRKAVLVVVLPNPFSRDVRTRFERGFAVKPDGERISRLPEIRHGPPRRFTFAEAVAANGSQSAESLVQQTAQFGGLCQHRVQLVASQCRRVTRMKRLFEGNHQPAAEELVRRPGSWVSGWRRRSGGRMFRTQRTLRISVRQAERLRQ